MTDPQLSQEVAKAFGRHLRANPPGDSNVYDIEIKFAVAIMLTAELVIPPQTKEARERRCERQDFCGRGRLSE